MHIYNNPGINYIELTDLNLCTKSNTTRVVRSLQKDGLVERRDHPEDGRSYQLYLTQKGKQIFLNVYPVYLAQIDQLMSSFNAEQIKAYSAVSQHIETVLAPKRHQKKEVNNN